MIRFLLLTLLLLSGCRNDCACGAGVEPLVLEEAVDLLEVNQTYDSYGQRGIKQVIFWRWDGDRNQVIAWRMYTPAMEPRRDGTGFVSVWRDGEKLRKVRAKDTIETHSQFDHEVDEREFIPLHERKGLRGERGAIALPVRKRVDVLGWLKMWGGE